MHTHQDCILPCVRLFIMAYRYVASLCDSMQLAKYKRGVMPTHFTFVALLKVEASPRKEKLVTPEEQVADWGAAGHTQFTPCTMLQ